MAVEQKFFYANGVAVATSAYDLVLRLMRSTMVPKEEIGPYESTNDLRPEEQDLLVVHMSLSHAKSMIPILVRMVQDYERDVGPIPSTEDDKKIWASVMGGGV